MKKVVFKIVLIFILILSFSIKVYAEENLENQDSEKALTNTGLEAINAEETENDLKTLEGSDTSENIENKDKEINKIESVEDKDKNLENSDEKDTAKLEIKYEYDKKTNQVTAVVTSKIGFKNTKPTWKLSKDSLTYTKTFSANQTYTTPFQEIDGNVIELEIVIKDVQIAKLEISYNYNQKANQVVATVTSNIELENTKPTWNLSEDKLTYTKTFGSNQKYNTPFKDIYGNTIELEINITQVDKVSPKIKLEYKYNEDDTVTVYMKSNEMLGDTKPTWTLSEDNLTYEKIFSTNQNYTTPVEDLCGNITNVKIYFEKRSSVYNQTDGSTIIVGYIKTSSTNVIVQIISSVEMQDTKPTWELSEDGFVYTKNFSADAEYTTPIVDINDNTKNVYIKVDDFYKVSYGKGVYGVSGAKYLGLSGGSDLIYYKYGNGQNVMFATFCVHGYEDAWDRDGKFLVDTANEFYNRLISDMDKDLAKKWTIYIFPEVNPDGRRLGYTKNGPGRTTLYSKTGKGIDLNRVWQTDSTYKTYSSARNYNGTTGFQAYEAEYLKNFLLSHKSSKGQTILVDLHGWENQLIGDVSVCKYYKEQYTTCSTKGYGNYGTQYLITWAKKVLGAKVSLVELPYASNENTAKNMKLSSKYIEATLKMLKSY